MWLQLAFSKAVEARLRRIYLLCILFIQPKMITNFKLTREIVVVDPDVAQLLFFE
jgi:hypothetical protein